MKKLRSSSPTWSAPANAATSESLFCDAFSFYLVSIRNLAAFYASPFAPRRRRFHSMDEGVQAARLAIWSAITSWKSGSSLELGEWIKLSFHNRLRCPHRSDTSYRYSSPSRALANPRVYLSLDDTPVTDLATQPDTGDARQLLSHLVSHLSPPAGRVLENMPDIWAERKASLSLYFVQRGCAAIGVGDAAAIKAIAAEFADLRHCCLSTDL